MNGSKKVIDRQMLLHVAHLAHLELKDEDIEKLLPQLKRIVEYVGKLQELDLEGVEPTSHVVNVTTYLRPDEPKKWFSVEEALANCPETDEGYFIVPKIIEEPEEE